jgi:actin-like ATPase involved in cell morphogenesis
VTTSRYDLGIDLGTTYTAAAVHHEGAARIVLLGSRGATIPSLVFLRDDQAVLTGEAAERRGVVEPTRLAREFKRRVGDSAPIMLAHAPYSAERLMAAVLKEVVAAVATREGAEADHVAVSHPANWGLFKIDLLRHALDLAGLRSVTLLTEPVAAAVHYASREQIGPDSIVAVYDLGGGTFDAAVLKKTGTGFETLGEPEGIERLGGIDFDEAVFAYVRNELHGKLEELDGSDPSIRVAIGRLRRDCVGAKEALSADSETTIPVALPNVHTGIRLTRAEFEPMIQPAIGETIEALRRAVERAGVRPDDLDAVLLVGGSSQIPLVSQMVASSLGRPVAIDVHPKHSVALGAAVVAASAHAPARAGALARATTTSSSPPPPTSDPPGRGDGARGGPGRATDASTRPGRDLPAPAPARASASASAPTLAAAGRAPGGARRLGLVAAALVVASAAAIGTYALRSDAGGAQEDQARTDSAEGAEDSEDADTGRSPATTAPATTDPAATDPSTAPCASDSGRCAAITGIRLDGDRYEADYSVATFDPLTPENGGTPDDHHVHFFFDTTPPEHAGTNSEVRGPWVVWDRVAGDGALLFDQATVAGGEEIGAKQLCVLVADASHGVEQRTGNCVDLPT